MHIPKHIAFIMDGNGRWAVQHGLSRSIGHRVGIAHILDVLDICHNFEIDIVSAYVWSTENWKRPTEEVQALMSSIEELGPQLANELHNRKVRNNFKNSDRSRHNRGKHRIPSLLLEVVRRNRP